MRCTICDLTICSDKSIFGQVGPKMGSVDPGHCTAFLARVVGEQKAREMWHLCRRYPGPEAVAMGLANACVPADQLDAEVHKWVKEPCERSPTAIAIAKRRCDTDTAHQSGIAGIGMVALKLYYDTEESREGAYALTDKRKLVRRHAGSALRRRCHRWLDGDQTGKGQPIGDPRAATAPPARSEPASA